MTSIKRALQAAAGAAAGEALYVEDVFSTYLYTGNGASQTIENGIALGDRFVGTSTFFDGSSDYLTRSSDLTGNSDSGTFTLSFWLRPTSLALDTYVYRSGTGFQFWVSSRDNGGIDVIGYDSGGSKRLEIGIAAGTCSVNSWTHVLVSVDLSDTGSRYVYINDSAVTPSYFVYQNASINFTNTAHGIAADSTGSSKYTGYLAHFYLDHTYRDLSVTANRRYFIDANGCATSEATQSALNPILYLPLTNSTTSNSGTGGNFTANGSPSIEDKGVGYEAGYGEGGMVWIKCRSYALNNAIQDTVRGGSNILFTNTTAGNQAYSTSITSFNADGFSLGSETLTNFNAQTFASWTFRKAPKFFDVVTFTAPLLGGATVSHNLGSVPACIIIKATSSTGAWYTYHESVATKYLMLNNSNAAASFQAFTNITDSSFDVASGLLSANASYVAYLFASDAGGFGDDENIIKCGSYTGTGANDNAIDVGFEPQWLLWKPSSTTGDWQLVDNMRGFTASGVGVNRLEPNTSDAEAVSGTPYCDISSTGFVQHGTSSSNNGSGQTYIYIAIRRPMKTPESGTEVFAADTADSTVEPYFVSNFVVDAVISRDNKNTATNNRMTCRLTQARTLYTDVTNAESSNTNSMFDYMNGYRSGTGTDAQDIAWMFKRATGFFDVVCYTGTSTTTTRSHNLGVVPELIISKPRGPTYSGDWVVYHSDIGINSKSYLNDSSAFSTTTGIWGSSAPTASTWTQKDSSIIVSGENGIAYLFATLAGVSKVGSYTGTGSNINVDCGFSAGARFILIKRTDSTGDWYVYDSARGIVAGNDPYLLLNSTAAEVTSTDYIDPLSSGFTVTSSAPAALNASGGTYIYLAIA